MKITNLILFSSLLLIQTHSLAGQFYLAPEGGRNNITIDSEYTLDDYDSDTRGTIASLVVGHHFDSNLILEGSYSHSFSDNLFGGFDSFHINEVRAALGYNITLSPRVHLVPILGATSWRFEAKEGSLFNPGDEDKRKISGTDMFGRLNLEFLMGGSNRLYVSYVNTQYDFGRANSLRVGFKFYFN